MKTDTLTLKLLNNKFVLTTKKEYIFNFRAIFLLIRSFIMMSIRIPIRYLPK